VIILKRQEGSSFRREIFTLLHEFAHYLLNIEEVEELKYEILANNRLSHIELWCNEFAFYFLIGTYEQRFNDITVANAGNDYQHELISDICKHTHLSEIALYTRLYFDNKISSSNYASIKKEAELKFKERYEEIKKQRELDKERGIETKGSAPRPIKSDLLISTIQAAFYEGVIDEYQVCKTLKITPDKIGVYIQ
jgi:Zn-dependent peptidase ImmA (M78 family)